MSQKLRVWVTRPIGKPDKGVVEVTVEHARMGSRDVRVSSARLGETEAMRTVLELLDPLLPQNRTTLDPLVEDVLVASSLLRQTSEWKWAESCCELWADGGTWTRRASYVGGIACVPGGGTLPLGYVGATMREAWDNLLRNLSALSSPCAVLEPVNTEDNVLRMDGHSAGILLHELVGHPAEEDFPSCRPLIRAEDLDIRTELQHRRPGCFRRSCEHWCGAPAHLRHGECLPGHESGGWTHVGAATQSARSQRGLRTCRKGLRQECGRGCCRGLFRQWNPRHPVLSQDRGPSKILASSHSQGRDNLCYPERSACILQRISLLEVKVHSHCGY